MARGKSKAKRKTGKAPVSRRAGVVWGSLVGSMTLAAGLLMVLDGGASPRMDGLALPPLMAAAGAAPSIEAVLQTRAALDHGRWKSIVIHHSGSPVGKPASLDAEHRRMNLKGLGYHFVIGNGAGMENGEVHVGYRWMDQAPGAHAGGDNAEWYNLNSIGICLVGDGDRDSFTDEQLRRLSDLVNALAREFKIPRERILLHSDIAPVSDPGPMFPAALFHEQIVPGA